MRRCDELHASLGDRAGRCCFELRTDLVDDDHLRHVVFDGLDHHRVLEERRPHLHAPGAPDSGVRDVAVAADFV